MELLPEVQEAALTLLCFDPVGAPIAEQYLPVEVYDPFYVDIAKAACQHRKKFKNVPGEHTYDLIEALAKRFPDNAESYRLIYASMDDSKESIQRDYVLSRAQTFYRWQKLRESAGSILQSLEKHSEEGVTEAEDALRKSLRTAATTFDSGTSMSDIEKLSAMFDKTLHKIPCGIKELDSINACPTRGRLTLLLGRSGRGKSWFLVNCAKHAAKAGYRVLYVTMEMPEIEVGQRIYQALFSVSEDEAITLIRKIQSTKGGDYEGITTTDIPKRPRLSDSDAYSRLKRNLGKSARLARKIRIKEFPNDSLTVEQLSGYLDALALHEGFVPDLLITDYGDLFKKNPDDIRGSLRMIHEGLKREAMLRNMAVVSVTQSNRGGMGGGLLTEKHTAEDISKVQTSDHFLTLNQTDPELAIGFARIYVAKNRSGRSQATIALTQQLAIGQFCISSAWYDTRMDQDVERQNRGPAKEGTDFTAEEIP